MSKMSRTVMAAALLIATGVAAIPAMAGEPLPNESSPVATGPFEGNMTIDISRDMAGGRTGDRVVRVPTVAVLPFTSRGYRGPNDPTASAITALLQSLLLARRDIELVDPAELEVVLTRLRISSLDMIDAATRQRLRRLTGARILIIGSVIPSGEKNFIVAKVMSTETNRVVGASVNTSGELTGIVPDLAEKISRLIEEKGAELLQPPLTVLSVAGKLCTTVKGDERTVYVQITGTTGVPHLDLTAQTEVKELLRNLGFTVVPERRQAEFQLIGKGVATPADAFRDFSSAAAELNLTLFRSDEMWVSELSRKKIAAPTYEIAAREALIAAALSCAEQMIPAMK